MTNQSKQIRTYYMVMVNVIIEQFTIGLMDTEMCKVLRYCKASTNGYKRTYIQNTSFKNSYSR